MESNQVDMHSEEALEKSFQAHKQDMFLSIATRLITVGAKTDSLLEYLEFILPPAELIVNSDDNVRSKDNKEFFSSLVGIYSYYMAESWPYRLQEFAFECKLDCPSWLVSEHPKGTIYEGMTLIQQAQVKLKVYEKEHPILSIDEVYAKASEEVDSWLAERYSGKTEYSVKAIMIYEALKNGPTDI